MRRHPIVQLTLVKLRGMLREPEAVFWIFVFPVLLALVLGIAFRSKGPEVLAVAVQEGPGAQTVLQTLDDDAGLSAEILDEATARNDLRTGRVALVVLPGQEWTYWYDPTRPESREARLLVNDALQNSAGRVEAHSVATREITEKGSRYIDFLVPGLLGMNLMGTGMWGIGFGIVISRQRRVLKRFVSTPMRRSHYLLGQILGRLVFLVLEVGVLVLFAHFVFGVPLRGALPTFALVCALGAMTFAGLGLLVASRARTVEGISGLMNVVMMPMWIMSGIFFSTSRFPDFLVMIDGASLFAVSGELAIAAAWGVAGFVGALFLFRWY
jgi:ABC-type multidrug transport system permease subunit